MNKKIASFIPNFWSTHLETDLELIKKHVDDGDQVRVYICEGELPSCYGNLSHENQTCKTCRIRINNGFDLLQLNGKIEVVNFANLREEDRKTLQKYRDVTPLSVDDLRSIRIENCYVGKAAFNEIASHLRESAPSITENADYFRLAIEAGAMTYLSFKNNLSEFKPDRFYTFNGRFVVANAAIAAAKALGVPYAVHDRGFRQNVYSVVYDGSLHSLDSWSKRISEHWEASTEPLESKAQQGATWFDQRVKGTNASLFSFTSDQTIELPANFDPNNYNVVFYNTSEFETVGMDDYKLPLHDSQNAGIEQIARDLAGTPGIHLYLRVHPNLKGRNNTQTRFIEEQLTDRFPHLTVIPADSPIKTYGLMSKADVVITFGSTAGAEAAFLKRPSVLLGPAPYRDLDFCYVPKTQQELIDTLKNRKLQLNDAELDERWLRAVKFGYFMVTGGTEFVYFEENEKFEIYQKGTQAKVAWHDPNAVVEESPEPASTPAPARLRQLVGSVKHRIKQLLVN